MASIRGGFRVVRGPDWSPSNEDDGGEGGVGTVVENSGQTGEDGNSAAAGNSAADRSSQLGRVWVQWDTGAKNIYRCGAEGKYELRLLDTSLAGVCHEGASCSECGQNPITGIRWRCRDCADTNLCSRCYGNSEHEIDHRFCAIVSPLWKSLIVSRRNGSSRVMAVGLFVGATVCRGPDWDYDQPDGDGEVEVGIVKEISQPDPTSRRGSAAVEWPGSLKMTCRLVTHDGKVDLKCVHSAKGGFYYRDHLPVLGSTADLLDEERCNVTSPQLDVSCLVQVPLMDREILEVFSEQIPNAPSAAILSEMMFELGEVKSVNTGRDTAEVFFMKRGKCFPVHCAALEKVQLFEKYEEVMLVPDKVALTLMMKQVGGREGELDEHVAKVGKVRDVRDDFHVLVEFGEKQVLLHPGSVVAPYDPAKIKAPARSTPSSASGGFTVTGTGRSGKGQDTRRGSDLSEVDLTSMLTKKFQDDSGLDHLMMAAITEGDFPLLEMLCEQNRDHINETLLNGCSTYAHLAVSAGRPKSVEILAKHGCDLSTRGDGSGTPMHAACVSSGVSMLECLLRLGAAWDVPGNMGEFPLHLVSEQGNHEAAKLLIRHGAVVDCVNAKGDTPLHDAIRANRPAVVQVLLDAGASLDVLSENDFNAAQHAAFHGSCNAMQIILNRVPEMVNNLGSVDFSVANIAAHNNFILTLGIILDTPVCNVNIQSSEDTTPLMSAVSCGGRACVEVLVGHGARVQMEDDVGNTALHVAIGKHSVAERGTLPDGVLVEERDPAEHSPQINALMAEMPFALEPSRRLAAIACFLAQQGCDINYFNHMGQSPVTGCVDDRMRLLLHKHFAPNRGEAASSARTAVAPPVSVSASPSPLPQPPMERPEVVMNAEQTMTNPEVLEAPPPRNSDASLPEEDAIRLCCVRNCSAEATVLFQPCGHTNCCEACYTQFNLCITCKAIVEKKLLNGKELGGDVVWTPSVVAPPRSAGAASKESETPAASIASGGGSSVPAIAPRLLASPSVTSAGGKTPETPSSGYSSVGLATVDPATVDPATIDPATSPPSSSGSSESSGTPPPPPASTTTSAGRNVPDRPPHAGVTPHTASSTTRRKPIRLACNFSNPYCGPSSTPRSTKSVPVAVGKPPAERQ